MRRRLQGGGVLVGGPPGYGKSTFAAALGTGLAEQGWLVAWADLRMASGPSGLVAELARALFGGVIVPAELTWAGVVRAVGSLSCGPRLGLGPGGGIAFDYPRLSPPQLRTAVQELVRLADHAAASAGKPALLVLDELPEGRALCEELEELLVVALARAGSLRLLALGIGPAFAAAPGQPSPASSAWGEPIELPGLDGELVRRRLAAQADRAGALCAPAALAELAHRIDGHPRVLALVGDQLFARPRRAPHLGRSAVEEAWQALLEREAAHHMALWRALRPQKKAVLAAVSLEGLAPYSRAFRERHQLGTVSAVQKAMAALAGAGFVRQRDSREWFIVDPLLRDFLAAATGGKPRRRQGIPCG